MIQINKTTLFASPCQAYSFGQRRIQIKTEGKIFGTCSPRHRSFPIAQALRIRVILVFTKISAGKLTTTEGIHDVAFFKAL